MSDLTFNLYGTDELIARLGAIKDFWTSPELKSVLEDAKNSLIRLARQAVPKASRLLSRKIDGIVEDFGTTNPRIRFGIMNQADAPYGKYVEEGTDPHPIFPRNKQYLRWTTKGPRGPRVPTPPGVMRPGLTEVFRDFVFHPGTRAQPFVRPQLGVVRPRLMLALARVLQAKMGGSAA